MARKRTAFFAGCAWCVYTTLATPAMAAVYDTKFWTLTGSFSYEVVNPPTLNANSTNNPLQGLIGERFRIEHGLYSPSWTHWLEAGMFSGAADGQDTSLTKFSQKVSYMSVMPVGLTFWFSRTAYIDFGLSAGAGFAMSPKYTNTTTTSAGVATVLASTGGSGPIFSGSLAGRFWLGKYIGMTLEGGMRMYNPTFVTTSTSTSAISGKTNLSSLSIVAGMTIAIGGVKGTGRSFVEVIPAEGVKNQAAKPAVKPVIKKIQTQKDVKTMPAMPDGAAPMPPAEP